MKHLSLVIIPILTVFLLSGCSDTTITERGHNADWNDGYDAAMSDFQEKADKLEESENCVYLLREQSSETYNSVQSTASDLEDSLSGDYYDLYNASDSARFDLQMMDFLNPCP